MSRDINPFGLRMPAELRDRIEKVAAANGRSMNTEIVHRLEQSLERAGDSQAQDTDVLTEVRKNTKAIEALARAMKVAK